MTTAPGAAEEDGGARAARLRRWAPRWQAALLVACGLAAAALSREGDWHPLGLLGVLAAFGIVSESVPVRLRGHVSMSGEALALVLAMALLGPAPAVAMAVVSALATAVPRRIRPRFVLRNVAAGAGFALAGGVFAAWLAEASGLRMGDPAFALVVVATYVVTFAVNVFLIAAFERLEGGERMGRVVRALVPVLPAQVPGALLAGATVFFYENTGLRALALFAVVLLAFQYLLRELRTSQERADELHLRAEELARLHGELSERSRRVAELAEGRGRLVAQALDAEDRERRALAEALHDEAIQNLLAAGHDLEDAAEGSEDGLGRARFAISLTVRQLREAVFELHPAVLRHAGLAAALRAVAAQQGRRGGFEARVEVDESATGIADSLVYSLAREQLVNAAKHAAATRVRVTLARRGEQIGLEVADDGRGMEPETRRRAAREGHIGLASSAERVEALGGRLEIESAPGEGTTLRTTLPVGRGGGDGARASGPGRAGAPDPGKRSARAGERGAAERSTGTGAPEVPGSAVDPAPAPAPPAPSARAGE